MALQVNQTIKVELNFFNPTQRLRDLLTVDSLAVKLKSPAVVTDARFYEQLYVAKLQRQSKYNVILLLDKDGATFGLSKMYKVPNLQALDGIDIVLTRGRNQAELKNEINSVQQFLKMGRIKPHLRWGILVNAGQDHIDNCIAALKKAEVHDDMVKIMVNPGVESSTALAVVAACRTALGRERAPFKINTSDLTIISPDQNNLFYDVDANLML